MRVLQEKNLVLASGVERLDLATKALVFTGFGAGEMNCQLCGQRVKKWSGIKSSASGLSLKIGLNCHDSLAELKETGLWPVKKIKEEYRAAKKVVQIQKGAYSTRTLVGALRRAEIPSELEEALAFFEKERHPRTAVEAKLLLELALKRLEKEEEEKKISEMPEYKRQLMSLLKSR